MQHQHRVPNANSLRVVPGQPAQLILDEGEVEDPTATTTLKREPAGAGV